MTDAPQWILECQVIGSLEKPIGPFASKAQAEKHAVTLPAHGSGWIAVPLTEGNSKDLNSPATC